MTVQPITPHLPACFGVCCPQHADCARYAAVERMTDAYAIATCDDEGIGSRPLFQQRPHQEQPA